MIHNLTVLAVSQCLLGEAGARDARWPLGQATGTHLPVGSLVIMLILLVVVAGMVWGAARIRAYRERADYCSPRKLFDDLCRLHQLDWPSRRLLRQLARTRQVEHPAGVFLEPTWFDAEEIPPALQPWREELKQLKTRLF